MPKWIFKKNSGDQQEVWVLGLMGSDEPTSGSRAETKLAQGTRGFRMGGESIELLLLRGDPLTPFDDFANFDQKS